MKRISTAYSVKGNVTEAVGEIRSGIETPNPKAVLFFASSCYPGETLSKEMKAAYPDAVVFGCTTAGELINDKMLKNSLVAMAFDESVFEDVQIEILENISEKDNVQAAFNSFEKHFGTPMVHMDIEKYFGFVLFDGLSGAEEKTMASMGSRTNVPFIGGSAGDDLNFKCTWLYADGKVYTNAAILVLVKAATDFKLIKTQSFNVLDKKLTATKVNEGGRQVLEFNGKPAAEEYANVLGVSKESLAENFMHYPLGLVIEDDPYVRSPRIVDGESVRFYCHVLEEIELSVLESHSIVMDTSKALKEAKASLGGIGGLVNFHCILRTLELENLGQEPEYGAIFSGVPTVGFSTYGEAYLGHMNQTSTMIAFK